MKTPPNSTWSVAVRAVSSAFLYLEKHYTATAHRFPRTACAVQVVTLALSLVQVVRWVF